MKYCSKCEGKLIEGIRFCLKCGADVEENSNVKDKTVKEESPKKGTCKSRLDTRLFDII